MTVTLEPTVGVYPPGQAREVRAIVAAVRAYMEGQPRVRVASVLVERLADAGLLVSDNALRAAAKSISRGELTEVAIY